jgi:hypothetical protein
MKTNNETATHRTSRNAVRWCSLPAAALPRFVSLLRLRCGAVPSRFHHRELKLVLTSSRTGRVLLHALCALQRPSHCSWHWRGILREFNA